MTHGVSGQPRAAAYETPQAAAVTKMPAPISLKRVEDGG
jgi:hypothetical protein